MSADRLLVLNIVIYIDLYSQTCLLEFHVDLHNFDQDRVQIGDVDLRFFKSYLDLYI